jgi:hypothetical protein
MTTIRQLLDEKGHEVFSVAANDTVYAALGKMAEKNVGALAVIAGQKTRRYHYGTRLCP